MQIDVRNNIDEVLARMASYRREVVDKAIVSALNRCVEMARTDASKEIRAAGYNVKARAIKASASVRKASTGSLVAILRVSRKPIALINFGARQTTKGVSVHILNGRKTINHAFIATMPSGHKGVYVRKPGGRYVYKRKDGKVVSSQLPLRELFGPSVGGIYGTDRIQQAMARSIAANFERRFAHELQRMSR
jgi:hypothetical protein